MTEEQINVAIAEYCGWKDFHRVNTGIPLLDGWYAICPKSSEDESIPDYCDDLNAMHEAEKTFSAEQQSDYLAYCTDMTGGWYELLLMLPARQRAEAFLKTIGKWENSHEHKYN